MDNEAETLAKAVLAWWEEHQFDTVGPYGEFNAYDAKPDFVKRAEVIVAADAA